MILRLIGLLVVLGIIASILKGLIIPAIVLVVLYGIYRLVK